MHLKRITEAQLFQALPLAKRNLLSLKTREEKVLAKQK